MSLEQKLLDRFYEGYLYGVSEETIAAGVEVPLKDWFFKSSEDLKIKTVLRNKKIKANDRYYNIKLTIKYDPSEDFQPDYFHHNSYLTDGTLFLQALILENINTITSIPEHLMKQIDNVKSIEYIFGNAVITTEYGEFGTEDKPWLKERITCWLPVKFNYTLKEN